MSAGKILLGVVAGVAAGATLGILFAPEKGSNTRRQISKKGENYAHGLTTKFNDFIETISQKFEELSEEASEIVESGKSKLENVAARATHATNSANPAHATAKG